MKSRAIYNWSLNGTSAWWKIDSDLWAMSFIVSFSSKRVEGILASKFSINCFYKIFHVCFMKKTNKNQWREAGQTLYSIDNGLFQVNEAAICCYKELEARWISIPPYSPQLNPTEKLIIKIKAEIWKQWRKKTTLNLNMIKKIVDSIIQRDCSTFISSSKKMNDETSKIWIIHTIFEFS